LYLILRIYNFRIYAEIILLLKQNSDDEGPLIRLHVNLNQIPWSMFLFASAPGFLVIDYHYNNGSDFGRKVQIIIITENKKSIYFDSS